MKICYESIFAKHSGMQCNTTQVWLYLSQQHKSGCIYHYKHCSTGNLRKITIFFLPERWARLVGTACSAHHTLPYLLTCSGRLPQSHMLTHTREDTPTETIYAAWFSLASLPGTPHQTWRGNNLVIRGNDFAHRSLHPAAILPKVLVSFTLQQKTPPLPPSQLILKNRLQLEQGTCSASCFPGHWERMTWQRSIVNHLSTGEQPAPGWISFASNKVL